jgi:serine/threonine protein kinase
MIGETLGNYRILSELGKGRMGIVYLAEHIILGTRRAIKSPSPTLTHDSHFRERFYQEAKNQALLDHPNIVQFIDFFEKDGQFFLVTQYVDGQDLRKLVKTRGQLKEQDALSILRDVLKGLEFAHTKGMINSNVKPSNILIDKSGIARITNFAIASLVRGGVTSTGAIIGSPWYMSPEQIEHPGQLDPRTDIYSLGIVLYEMLAGDIPFNGETEFSVLDQQRHAPPPNLRQKTPEISEKLVEIVLKAMAKNPAERFQNCTEFLQCLPEQQRQRSEEDGRRKTEEQNRQLTTSNHVFICYAREDEAFVLQLVENLKGRGVPVWLDQWDIPPGADWDRSIDEALYGCAKFIIVLSSQAVESTEVRGELRTALDERKPIIPVIHSSCRLPRQLRTIQHVDFTSRSPDDEAGLRQLLRTLATSTNSNVPQQGRATDTPERAPQEPESKLKPGTIFLDAPVKIIFERGKEPFERGFPNNLVRRFAIGIENISSERLHHCSVTIQDVNPKAKLETDSSLKLSSPQNKTFGINAFDTEYIDIVQFDELNGFHENLGIELMCYSVHGFTNLPLEHHYTLTIRASAEKGRFAEEEFNLWIQDRKVHFTKLTT